MLAKREIGCSGSDYWFTCKECTGNPVPVPRPMPTVNYVFTSLYTELHITHLSQWRIRQNHICEMGQRATDSYTTSSAVGIEYHDAHHIV